MFPGTDCHGTPITERAKQEGKSPAEIAEYYHKEFVETFNKMNFSYDMYSETETEYHQEKVKEIFKKLYDNGYIYEKIEPQAYCPKCRRLQGTFRFRTGVQKKPEMPWMPSWPWQPSRN